MTINAHLNCLRVVVMVLMNGRMRVFLSYTYLYILPL